jgi:phosphoglucomutase
MHSHAGRQARPEDLVDLTALLKAYDEIRPDVSRVDQRVTFGTSGHRGSSLDGAFNEAHILAISQAIAEHRASAGITGPLFLGRDTHGLSEPAWRTALEVLVANGVEVMVDSRDGFTPTPAVSHAILKHNRLAPGSADGVLITPSHNPPRDGGFKYNPPSGGPAGSDATTPIAARANQLLKDGLTDVRRIPFERARRRRANTTSWPTMSTTCPASWTWRPCAAPASGSRPTRWAAPPSAIGARSPTGTGWT